MGLWMGKDNMQWAMSSDLLYCHSEAHLLGDAAVPNLVWDWLPHICSLESRELPWTAVGTVKIVMRCHCKFCSKEGGNMPQSVPGYEDLCLLQTWSV